MATVLGLKKQVETVNEIGKNNLSLKEIYLEENATTYEIVDNIAQIVTPKTNYVTVRAEDGENLILLDSQEILRNIKINYNGDIQVSSVVINGDRIKIYYGEDGRLAAVKDTLVDFEEIPVEYDSDRIYPILKMSQYFYGELLESTVLPPEKIFTTSFSNSEVYK